MPVGVSKRIGRINGWHVGVESVGNDLKAFPNLLFLEKRERKLVALIREHPYITNTAHHGR